MGAGIHQAGKRKSGKVSRRAFRTAWLILTALSLTTCPVLADPPDKGDSTIPQAVSPPADKKNAANPSDVRNNSDIDSVTIGKPERVKNADTGRPADPLATESAQEKKPAPSSPIEPTSASTETVTKDTAPSSAENKIGSTGEALAGGDKDAEQTADSPPQLLTLPDPNTAGPPEWHRLQMKLSGSMCIACLKDLEEHLRKMPGIDRVKVQRPPAGYSNALSPDVTNWAQGCILVDLKRMPMEFLRSFIRQNGYHAYHIVDKQLDHQPEDRDLKL